ncbi:MAG TPA: hypothetical protein VK997_08455 [Deferrisomatales bacterium]|nr:hypothetical protein [Deferrisomatales bacterium]
MGSLPALIAVLALVVTLVLVVAYTLATGVSPMPTGRAARAALLGELPADPGGTVFELGAGWGGLAAALARRYPTRPVVGYELSPVPWLFAALGRWCAGPANLTLRRADFLRADLSPAGLIVCYLCPAGMARLRPKLEAELRPGSVVVSHFFALPGWRPEQPVARAADAACSPIYRYCFPRCLAPTVAPGGEPGRNP